MKRSPMKRRWRDTGPDQHEFMSAAIAPKPPVTSSKQLDAHDVDAVIVRLEERKRKETAGATPAP